MNIEYRKHYSHSLGRDMEYKIYGHAGKTALVFPSQDGRFYDYENFGMINELSEYIESGRLRVVCCDGIDWETWSNLGGDKRWRIEQHERWYHYIVDELVPAIGDKGRIISTGCSMGGFHSANFFFRRPDIFDTLIAQSGLYHASYFFGDYSDELVYSNSPEDYLTHMPDDHYYWNEYRNRRIIVSVGQGNWEDDLLASTRRLDEILHRCGVNNVWFDYWGYDVAHDWCWWRPQIKYFMGKVL
ncbi:MAG: prolyl oligopeptidase family serine peptidase [Bacteroidales bacterium]|nr:prolyl oligopeptidase family serine peptidase [Bacteroidales bacterium]